MPAPNHLPNVRAQFDSLNAEGERLACSAGFDLPIFSDFRYSTFHDGGGKNNHVQGVQRRGNFLFVTGSFPFNKKRSDLFVLELGSRAADPGPWGSNLMRNKDPVATDRLVNYFKIDPDFWHPGGCSLDGNSLIVPLEASGQDSVITFVDVSNPASPLRNTADDVVRTGAKGGALAATRLPSDHLLVAVWSDSETSPAGAAVPFRLDLYVSSATTSPYGLRLLAQHKPAAGDEFHRKFQSMDFLWEESAAGRKLHLIGFENTAEPQPDPTNPGVNVAVLFEVRLPAAWLAPGFNPAGEPLGVQIAGLTRHVATHTFSHDDKWFNMDAGSCAYVDSNQQLIVYCVHHHRTRLHGTLSMQLSEFRSTAFQQVIDHIEDAWVELHETLPDPDGRRLTLLGPFDSSIDDCASQCFVKDKAFTKVTAARWQIPAERAYVLYPQKSFQGNGALVLKGTGVVFGTDFPGIGQFSMASCRFQPLSVALALPGATVFGD